MKTQYPSRPSIPFCALLIPMLGMIAPASTQAAEHTYTTTKGVEVTADSAAINGDQAILRRTDGKFFTVPLAQLSAQDQVFAKTHRDDIGVAAPVAATSPAPTTSAIAATPPAAPPVAASADGNTPWRLEIRTNSGKSSRVSARYSDDRVVKSQYSVDVTNREVSRNLEGARATLVVFGRAVVDNKEYKVLNREEWAVSVEAHKSQRLEGKEFQTIYDDSNTIREGYRLHGFVFAIHDASGKMIATDASSPTMLKVIEKALPLQFGAIVDPEMKPRQSVNSF